jgi:manganese/zinc/iron transport system permease protein
LVLVAALYRPLLTLSFDRAFAASIGLPVRFLDGLFQLFLAFAIVVSLQAVGVVLVSALLITPAAAAYLLTDRLHRMIWIAAVIGMLSAVLGVFLSFLGNDLPTGPFMVLAATTVFLVAYLFAPQHGRLTIWLRRRARRRKVRDENALKEIYRILEAEERGSVGEAVVLTRLAEVRKMTLADVLAELSTLAKEDLVLLAPDGGKVSLLPEGLETAQQIVRNHRLWELYLTNEADYEPDHVHDDAEKIEHFLGEREVAELERQLHFPQTDPHGKPIPGGSGA